MRRRLPPQLRRQHHLDRRAAQIRAATDGPPDELIDTRTLAQWLGVSVQWCEITRHKGWDPQFTKLGPHRIRYRRDAVRAWLQEREHQSTSQPGENR